MQNLFELKYVQSGTLMMKSYLISLCSDLAMDTIQNACEPFGYKLCDNVGDGYGDSVGD